MDGVADELGVSGAVTELVDDGVALALGMGMALGVVDREDDGFTVDEGVEDVDATVFDAHSAALLPS